MNNDFILGDRIQFSIEDWSDSNPDFIQIRQITGTVIMVIKPGYNILLDTQTELGQGAQYSPRSPSGNILWRYSNCALVNFIFIGYNRSCTFAPGFSRDNFIDDRFVSMFKSLSMNMFSDIKYATSKVSSVKDSVTANTDSSATDSATDSSATDSVVTSAANADSSITKTQISLIVKDEDVNIQKLTSDKSLVPYIFPSESQFNDSSTPFNLQCLLEEIEYDSLSKTETDYKPVNILDFTTSPVKSKTLSATASPFIPLSVLRSNSQNSLNCLGNSASNNSWNNNLSDKEILMSNIHVDLHDNVNKSGSAISPSSKTDSKANITTNTIIIKPSESSKTLKINEKNGNLISLGSQLLYPSISIPHFTGGNFDRYKFALQHPLRIILKSLWEPYSFRRVCSATSKADPHEQVILELPVIKKGVISSEQVILANRDEMFKYVTAANMEKGKVEDSNMHSNRKRRWICKSVPFYGYTKNLILSKTDPVPKSESGIYFDYHPVTNPCSHLYFEGERPGQEVISSQIVKPPQNTLLCGKIKKSFKNYMMHDWFPCSNEFFLLWTFITDPESDFLKRKGIRMTPEELISSVNLESYTKTLFNPKAEENTRFDLYHHMQTYPLEITAQHPRTSDYYQVLMSELLGIPFQSKNPQFLVNLRKSLNLVI